MKHFKPGLCKSERVAQNFYMPTPKGRVSISPTEIIYLEAKINYTVFHTTESTILASFHLKFFNEVLKDNPDFLRIHRNCLINLNYLSGLKWETDIKEAQLKNGTSLAISRRKAKELKAILLSKRLD